MLTSNNKEDNAFIEEAFFEMLKKEEIYARIYETMKDVLQNLPRFTLNKQKETSLGPGVQTS